MSEWNDIMYEITNLLIPEVNSSLPLPSSSFQQDFLNKCHGKLLLSSIFITPNLLSSILPLLPYSQNPNRTIIIALLPILLATTLVLFKLLTMIRIFCQTSGSLPVLKARKASRIPGVLYLYRQRDRGILFKYKDRPRLPSHPEQDFARRRRAVDLVTALIQLGTGPPSQKGNPTAHLDQAFPSLNQQKQPVR